MSWGLKNRNMKGYRTCFVRLTLTYYVDSIAEYQGDYSVYMNVITESNPATILSANGGIVFPFWGNNLK